MLHYLIFPLSVIVTFLFFIYGYNCYYLLGAARRYSNPNKKGYDGQKPSVAVHLPIYNEKYVIYRLIDTCARMAESYDKHRVRIMILDDSDDETEQEVTELVQRCSKQGFRIEVLRRDDRQGFKAGALQAALERTDEEYIVIFDADFIPPPDFLTRTVPYLIQDEKLGIVQSRWGHVNRSYNFITRAVSIGMDAHFLIEQPGRYAADCFLNFNGSGGVIRREALVEAGGWHSDTLAEDLDASYRIQMKGYRVLYLRDLQSLGEVTPTVPSFKRQQGRWACGSLQTAKKTLPQLLSCGKITRKQKVQAFVHLTYYVLHPLMFTSFLLASLAAILSVDAISIRLPQVQLPVGIDAIFSLIAGNLLWILLGSTIVACTVAAWVYYAAALKFQGLSLIKNLPSLIILGLIGYGISLSNTIEAMRALLTNKRWSFKRTPKYAVQKSFDEWRSKKYHVPLDVRSLFEIMASILGFVAIVVAIRDVNWGIVPILALYTMAYTFVGYLTLTQSKKEM